MTGRNRLNRRRFLVASLAAIAASSAARAQQAGKVYRLAILSPVTPVADMTPTRGANWKAFFEELRRLGYVEGRTLAVERRSAEGKAERLPALAGEVVALRPHVIFATDLRGAEALKAATRTIPIVAFVNDPVRSGLALSLARPGGNVTGFTVDAGLGIIGKRIELLKEAIPTASTMAFLTPRRAGESRYGELFQEAARRARVTLVEAQLRSPVNEAEYRRAFAAMVRGRVDSLYVVPNSENYVNQRLIANLAAEARVPTIFPFREGVGAGGLMAYATDVVDIWRRSAGYIDRILKGADPAEMPFQQPTKFELVINLKTAKALGLTIPDSLLARADEVIE